MIRAITDIRRLHAAITAAAAACALVITAGCTTRVSGEDAFYVTADGMSVCPDSIIDAVGHVLKPAASAINTGSAAATMPMPRIITSTAIIDAACLSEMQASDTSVAGYGDTETLLLIGQGVAAAEAAATPVQDLTAVLLRHFAGLGESTPAELYARGTELFNTLTDSAYDITERMYTGTPRHYAASCLPAWFDDNDRRALLSAAVAVDCHRALSLLESIAPDSGTAPPAVSAENVALAARSRLWIPDRGMLSAYLYTRPYPIQLQATDTRATSEAVIYGMLTGPMAVTAVERMPVYGLGMPPIYPTPAVATDTVADSGALALKAVAACRVNNTQALDHALASLMTNSLTGATQRQGTPVLTAVLRGVFGMSLTAAGLLIEPCVPQWMDADKSISGLRWHDATLDITVRGTGDIISTFAIDRAAIDGHTVPADLKGHHTVTVTLTGASHSRQGISIVQPRRMPPASQMSWHSQRDVVFGMTGQTTGNILYLNGQLDEVTDIDSYTVPEATGPVWLYAVPVDANGTAGMSAPPHIIIPSTAELSFPASRVAAPGARILSDRKQVKRGRRTRTVTVQSRFEKYIVQSTRWHNATLTFHANIRHAGRYGVDVEYLDGLGVVNDERGMTTRRLTVNGHDSGTLQFVQLGPDSWRPGKDWRTLTGYSNMLFVNLSEGENIISLTLPRTGTPTDDDDDGLLLIKRLRLITL